MKHIVVLFVVVAAVLLPLFAAIPARAAGDDSCCSPVKTFYCYACAAPQEGLLDVAQQKQPDPDPNGFWLRAGVLASQKTGLQVNFTGYGLATVVDPATHRLLDGVADVSVDNRMMMWKIAAGMEK